MGKDEVPNNEIEVIDIPTSFKKKIRTPEGEIEIEEALVIIMNDIKEIKKGVL